MKINENYLRDYTLIVHFIKAPKSKMDKSSKKYEKHLMEISSKWSNY